MGSWETGYQGLADIVQSYGFSDHVASIRGVDVSPLSFAAKEEGLAERMIEEALLAVEEDGAQAIVGYGGLTFRRALHEALPVPVINPLAAGILLAELLVRARAS